MSRTHVKTVSIATDHDKPQSKGQKAFNSLIKQIEMQRAQLAAWEAAVPPYQQKYASEMLPLFDISEDLQIRMVHCFDQACDQKGLTKPERRKIAGLIIELAHPLIAERGDEALKTVYNRHSGSDYDGEEAAATQSVKSMLEDILNIDLGDELDPLSPDDILQRAQEQMQERQGKEDAYWREEDERHAMRKKSAKQLAKEAQQQAEEQQISQSIREVYRKLASALHPDRETDPQERDRKTALMQRVNQAYAKNNPLKLLELQLELEHIDQRAINNISEERLKHYNSILKEQLGELKEEISHAEDAFRMQFGIDPFVRLVPKTLMRHLASDIAALRREISALENDLRAFEDIKQLKVWLKGLRRQRAMMDFNDCPF